MRAKDLIVKKRKDGFDYALRVPRVKQKDAGFRESFKTVPIVYDLYILLRNQCEYSQEYIEKHLRTPLSDRFSMEVPMFLETLRVDKIESLEQFFEETNLKPDLYHMSEKTAMNEMAMVSRRNMARSERTGDYINITSYRFRYTKGTNLARRGIQGVVLAEALDHSDTQHVGVYAANTVETAEIIDEVMAPALAPLAQAFAGTLIDSERDAVRANDPHSRVRNGAQHNVGNCGTYAFCASGYRACYTCVNFQPWLDAPHEEVRDEIHAERAKQEKIGVSPNVIQSTDRLLLAVEQVIIMCREAKEELVNE